MHAPMHQPAASCARRWNAPFSESALMPPLACRMVCLHPTLRSPPAPRPWLRPLHLLRSPTLLPSPPTASPPLLPPSRPTSPSQSTAPLPLPHLVHPPCPWSLLLCLCPPTPQSCTTLTTSTPTPLALLLLPLLPALSLPPPWPARQAFPSSLHLPHRSPYQQLPLCPSLPDQWRAWPSLPRLQQWQQ